MLHEIKLFHNSTSQKMKLFVNSKALLYCIGILLIWYIYKNQFCLYNILYIVQAELLCGGKMYVKENRC